MRVDVVDEIATDFRGVPVGFRFRRRSGKKAAKDAYQDLSANGGEIFVRKRVLGNGVDRVEGIVFAKQFFHEGEDAFASDHAVLGRKMTAPDLRKLLAEFGRFELKAHEFVLHEALLRVDAVQFEGKREIDVAFAHICGHVAGEDGAAAVGNDR